MSWTAAGAVEQALGRCVFAAAAWAIHSSSTALQGQGLGQHLHPLLPNRSAPAPFVLAPFSLSWDCSWWNAQMGPSYGWWICTTGELLALTPPPEFWPSPSPSRDSGSSRSGDMWPWQLRAVWMQRAQGIFYDTLIMLRTIPVQEPFHWEISMWLWEGQKWRDLYSRWSNGRFLLNGLWFSAWTWNVLGRQKWRFLCTEWLLFLPTWR